jgi:hypothetical protein
MDSEIKLIVAFRDVPCATVSDFSEILKVLFSATSIRKYA